MHDIHLAFDIIRTMGLIIVIGSFLKCPYLGNAESWVAVTFLSGMLLVLGTGQQ